MAQSRKFRGATAIFPPLAVVLAATMAAGCAQNAATGKSQLNFYSEAQEIRMGREADAEISAQMGVVDDPALQGYVSRVGRELAAKSERPGLPWSFKVMDDPMVNAFALPGGFIYVTRGILGHMSSEAELASVLGHEIGHVTAQHGVNQLSKSQLAQGGLLLGAILSPEVAQAADLAGVGMQVLFLKYGRDDESQADSLGLRYMANGGYETREMPRVFELLDRVSRASGQGRIPNWLSSHPDPGDRAARTRERIGKAGYPAGEVAGPEYVRQLDGLAFGPDPRNGYFEGGVFYHPEMRFQLRLPAGWTATNEATSVGAMHPEKIALVQLELAAVASPDEAARAMSSAQGISVTGTERLSVNGLAAVRSDFYAARRQGSALAGTALFVAHRGRVFQIVGLAVPERAREVQATIFGALESFAGLDDPRRLNVEPQRIEVVRLPSAMTFEEFLARYPGGIEAERARLVNGITDPRASIPAGTLLKRVVGRAVGDS